MEKQQVKARGELGAMKMNTIGAVAHVIKG
jgi:hypothetical protein